MEWCIVFFFQAEDGIRDHCVTGVQTCALPISQQAHRLDGNGDALAAADVLGDAVGAAEDPTEKLDRKSVV